MRLVFAFGLLLLLTACVADPRSLGITGPGGPPPVAAPAPNQPDTAPTPGVPIGGTQYGPNDAPLTGGNGFWGYN
ncbi:MAG TPA: hypothetical protein VGC09_16515 [Rhodopila sp.]